MVEGVKEQGPGLILLLTELVEDVKDGGGNVATDRKTHRQAFFGNPAHLKHPLQSIACTWSLLADAQNSVSECKCAAIRTEGLIS